MHLINQLYSAHYDFAPFLGQPPRSVMIATLPRSGSTHFCMEMWRTGQLGAPMEYVQYESMWVLRERLGIHDDFAKYWANVTTLRTSANGVFAYKMFMGNYRKLAEQDPRLLELIRPTHVIFLTRTDELAQAISYSRAIRSSQWFHGVPAKKGIPEYSRSHIKTCVDSIRNQKAFWRRVFDMTDATVLTVSYEDLMANRQATLQAVLDFVGIECDKGAALSIPELTVQRDESSNHWREAYERESIAYLHDAMTS